MTSTANAGVEEPMFTRQTFLPRVAMAAMAAAAVVAFAGAGCASRGQQPIGEYIDDAGTTTRVKTRLVGLSFTAR